MEETLAFLEEKAKEIKKQIEKAKKLIALAREMGYSVTEPEGELMKYESQLSRIERAIKKQKG